VWWGFYILLRIKLLKYQTTNDWTLPDWNYTKKGKILSMSKIGCLRKHWNTLLQLYKAATTIYYHFYLSLFVYFNPSLISGDSLQITIIFFLGIFCFHVYLPVQVFLVLLSSSTVLLAGLNWQHTNRSFLALNYQMGNFFALLLSNDFWFSVFLF